MHSGVRVQVLDVAVAVADGMRVTQDAMGVDPLSCRLKGDYCPACYEYFIQKLQAV
jgi:hypothetical protein